MSLGQYYRRMDKYKYKPSTHKELHCLNLVIPITNAQRDNENDCMLSLLLQKVLGTVGTLIEPNTKKSKKIQWIPTKCNGINKGNHVIMLALLNKMTDENLPAVIRIDLIDPLHFEE